MAETEKTLIAMVFYFLLIAVGSPIARWLFHGSNLYTPLGLFAVYVTSIIVFAHIYYGLYRLNRSHFSFASDVRGTRLGEVQRQLAYEEVGFKEDIRILSTVLSLSLNGQISNVSPEVINKFLETNHLDKSVLDISEGSYGYVRDYGYAEGLGLLYTIRGGDQGGTKESCFLITNSGSRRWLILNKRPHIGNITDGFKASLADAQEGLKKIEKRKATLDSTTPDIWNMIDFLYFSTITQTTVGYGDMLPNSTSVRLAVMIQVLLGLLFVGIVINMKLGGV